MEITLKIAVLFLLLTSTLFANEISKVDLFNVKWEVRDTALGVITYRQDNPDTRLVAVRGTTVIDAPLSLVLTILTNESFEKQKRWVPNLEEFTTLSKTSMLSRKLYVHVGFKWPVKDRDFAYSSEIYRKNGDIIVEYTSADTIREEKDGVVRGNMKTAFILKTLPDGRTAIDLRAIADPGGGIPKVFVNLAQRDYSETMLSRIRIQVEEERGYTAVHDDFKLLTFHRK